MTCYCFVLDIFLTVCDSVSNWNVVTSPQCLQILCIHKNQLKLCTHVLCNMYQFHGIYVGIVCVCVCVMCVGTCVCLCLCVKCVGACVCVWNAESNVCV